MHYKNIIVAVVTAVITIILLGAISMYLKQHNQRNNLNAKAKELHELQMKAKGILDSMMAAEKDVTNKKKELGRVSIEVEEERKAIDIRADAVETELAECKPALEAAQRAVSSIQKKNMFYVKAMKEPPKLIEMTIRAVMILMGKKIKDWNAVRKMLSCNDFIPSILNFDTQTITETLRKNVEREFLCNEDFTFERVNRASKAVAPLVMWVQSQVKFAQILDSVEPMRKEIQELKDKLKPKQKHAEELQASVIKLEKTIEEYKAEYQRRVQQITELKNETAIVEESMILCPKLG